MKYFPLINPTQNKPSLLSWERGLKYITSRKTMCKCKVAPLVGAWIEMRISTMTRLLVLVAPLVGAWIEITLGPMKTEYRTSLLSWERGLKCITHWYENNGIGRSSRGSVD